MKDYKKILEGVVNIIRTTEKTDIGFAHICSCLSDNCDELFESEDERIKRNIIAALKGEGYYDCDLTNECIAWLEKQGEKPQGKSALEASKEKKIDNANKVEPKDYSSIDPLFFNTTDKVEPKFKVDKNCKKKGGKE